MHVNFIEDTTLHPWSISHKGWRTLSTALLLVIYIIHSSTTEVDQNLKESLSIATKRFCAHKHAFWHRNARKYTNPYWMLLLHDSISRASAENSPVFVGSMDGAGAYWLVLGYADWSSTNNQRAAYKLKDNPLTQKNALTSAWCCTTHSRSNASNHEILGLVQKKHHNSIISS